MPRKNNFSIPMGDVTEVVSKTTKSKQGLRTTVEEVPFHSSKQTRSGQASRQAKVVEAQSSHPTQVVHESDTPQLIEPYEADVHDIQAEDTQPQLHLRSFVGTYGPMDRHPEQISLLVIRDGGSDEGSEVLHVHQFDANQVL
ncbi:hypothetical protein EDB89DRAFT_1907146 [Lactarius sanguifluus]|nr:hypothetical protein EDB89DRAFT_1907146 [Lactarius sanguifluus]